MRLDHLIFFLLGVGFAFAGIPNALHAGRRHPVSSEIRVEHLCARMHNNTAFIGAEPFARLLVDSARECQRSCMELHPKCTAVVFYYVYGARENHVCFLFDRNSANENVALVPERPRNRQDMVRALEIVSNCHEFDPFPPLPDAFVVSSDVVGRDKRAVGFDKPIPVTGPWTPWSSCNRTHTQIRTAPCEYGRKIQKRQCASRFPIPTQPPYVPSVPSVPYPPNPYAHPPATSPEYRNRMDEHKKQELTLCCYKLQSSSQDGGHVHKAIPSAQPCPTTCPTLTTIEYKGHTEILLPGAWGNWQEWSSCSVTCDSGTQYRVRSCGPGAPCTGPTSDSRPCNAGVKCNGWSEWCPWSPCSATCGHGIKTRERYCERGNMKCGPEQAYQEEACDAGLCPVAEWMPWHEWTPCSASCGGGQQNRYRECSGVGCPGSPMDVKECGTQPCPCWSEWGPWAECTVSCGYGGMKTRTRHCENGHDCEGSHMDSQPCPYVPCAEWLQWQEWSSCSVTCGPGEQTRTRYCSNGDLCPGEPSDIRNCNLGQCSFWSDWENWSPCSVTCGQGQKNRRRICNGYSCPGSPEETIVCQEAYCPVWGNWEAWSLCSVSCGQGTRQRERTCIGGTCQGPRFEPENCNLGPCAFWGQWEEWSQCSVSCGDGQQIRKRICQHGTDCPGSFEEPKYCNMGQCASWTDWTSWSQCSAQCGPGQRTRDRQCLTPYQTPSESCLGPPQETTACDGGACCQWSEWCEWSACDRDCGGGKKLRQRFCQRPSFGGDMITDPTCSCPGPEKDIQDCNQAKCPPTCAWTEWCPWTSCPDKDACKNAQSTRIRQCVGDAECHCYGFAEEKQFCRLDAVCDPPMVGPTTPAPVHRIR